MVKTQRAISFFVLLIVLLVSASSIQAQSLTFPNSQVEYLIVKLTTDKAVYSTGENILLSGQVTFSSTGKPAFLSTLCLGVLVVDARWETCGHTNKEGQFSATIPYGTAIPLGYSGLVYVEGSAHYEDLEGGEQMPVEYGHYDGGIDDNDENDNENDIDTDTDYDDYDEPPVDQYLDLELWGPLVPIQIGGWDEIQFGGMVTSQGVNVDDAKVSMVVAGQTFQTTTGKVESGKFYYGWPNNTFPAGEYVVQITVTKAGYQSATGNVAFTVFGEGYDFWVMMDPIPASINPGTKISFPGILTLGGNPVSDWIDIYITFPNGRTEGYSNLTDANGRFTHTQPSFTEKGTYQLVVHYQADDKQISDVYTFSVGTTSPATVTPTAPQPIQVPEKCEITDVAYPSKVVVGDNANVTGKVICTKGKERVPQEGWNITVFDMHSSVKAPVVQTSRDGSFTAIFPSELNVQEVDILARDPEIETRFAKWFGPFNVMVSIEPEISLSQTDYDQGEIIEGDLKLNPTNSQFCSMVQNWDSGVEIYYQVTGPVDGAAVQYLFESQYYSSTKIAGVEMSTCGVNHFYWMIPQNAGGGKYTLTAFISGKYITNQKVETDFYVNDIQHTNLNAVVEPDPEGWVSATLVGQYTDFNGVPIPDANVRVEFFIVKWNDDGTEIIGTREFKLTGTTDTFGNYVINLEPLDLFVGQGQEDPWKSGWATTTVYAEKEGFATGATIIDVLVPTVKARLEIISVDPSLDYLSKMAQAGLSYEQLTQMTIQIRVRYNNIFAEGAKLGISAQGDWAVSCSETDDQANFQAHLDINGQKMPEWTANKYSDKWTWYQNMVAWPNGTLNPFWYNYPKYSVTMPAKHGIAQESTISVSGKLFGYRYSENSPNQCGGNAWTSDTPSIPPLWVGARPVINIQIGFGGARAEVIYNIASPSISAKGSAWVSPTGGEFNGKINVGQATGFALQKQQVNLSIVSTDIGVTMVTPETEKPTSEITITPSVITDDKGELKSPLSAKTNPCALEKNAKYYVKMTTPALKGNQYIPIEMRCVNELKFEIGESDLHVVQAIDLTENKQIQLAAGKEAGVRVYLDVEGEIFQPENRPVQFDVKFELMAGADNTPLFPETKTVSVSAKGASVNWSSKDSPGKNAGIGKVATWENKGANISGKEVVPLDFLFTPVELNGGMTNYRIRITVDPNEVYGKSVVIEKSPVAVKNMKTLRLIIVPVDIYDLDMSFVLEQTAFLFETYPLGLSNLILDLRDVYESSQIPTSCTSVTLWKEIACGVGREYGVSSNSNDPVKVIAVVDSATWLQVNKAFLYAGGISALGTYDAEMWDSATNNVVVIRYPENVPNTTAHEIGHAYGLEPGEQYKDHPPHGLPVTGLILRDGKILDLSENLGSNDLAKRKNMQNAGWGGVSEIYDLMGNAGYHQDPVDDSIQLDSYQQSWIVLKTYNQLFEALKDPPDEDLFFVQGMIGLDGLVTLDPMVQTIGEPIEPGTKGDYELQFLDSAGNILYDTRFGYTSKPGLFNLQLPYTPGFERLKILYGSSIVGELIRSPNPPEISMLSLPKIGVEDTEMRIGWTGSDPDGDDLTYSLHYNCGESTPWVPIAANLADTTYAVNLRQISGGTCTFKVTASDGVNSTFSVSDSVEVSPKIPIVQILTESSSYEAGQPVLLKGQAFSLKDGVIPNENLHWTSDLDGELGYGRTLSLMLSEGTHLLTLWAEDSSGNFSMAETTIQVESESFLDRMGIGMQSVWIVGFLILAVMMVLGAVFIIWLVKKRHQPVPVFVQETPGQLPGTIKGKDGRWWYQDPNSGITSVWNGHSWKPAATLQPPIDAPTQAPKQRGLGSCLLTLLLSGLMAFIIFGGISLVGFNFIPGQTIQPAQNVIFADILKMAGGGLLLSLFGSLMLWGGIKSILTRQAVVDDEVGRRKVRKGCSAMLLGISQSSFGILLLSAGLCLMALSLFQQILPWLKFTIVF